MLAYRLPLYLLAPILAYAAPVPDARLVVDRSIESQESNAARQPFSDDHASFQRTRTADAVAGSTRELRALLLSGDGKPAGQIDDAGLRPATASNLFAGTSNTQSSDEDASVVGAADPARLDDRYTFRVFRDQAKLIPWRFAGAAAAISIGGFANWNWGSSRFRFNSEGWFEEDTASLGMDKLGHAYSSYVLAEIFADGINKKSAQNDRFGSYTGAILAMGLMTYIEVFDGFSKDHGFSHEDLLADAAGALFSIARRSVPGLREKVDFRLFYVPSRNTWQALSCFPKPHCDQGGEAVRSPITDYSGQRYLLAFRLSGFERFKITPLRFIEVHTGYYARGFTKEEEDRGDPLRRRLFVGLGLDVSELLFPGRPRGVRGAARWALQYLQVPYTAIHSD